MCVHLRTHPGPGLFCSIQIQFNFLLKGIQGSYRHRPGKHCTVERRLDILRGKRKQNKKEYLIFHNRGKVYLRYSRHSLILIPNPLSPEAQSLCQTTRPRQSSKEENQQTEKHSLRDISLPLPSLSLPAALASPRMIPGQHLNH